MCVLYASALCSFPSRRWCVPGWRSLRRACVLNPNISETNGDRGVVNYRQHIMKLTAVRIDWWRHLWRHVTRWRHNSDFSGWGSAFIRVSGGTTYCMFLPCSHRRRRQRMGHVPPQKKSYIYFRAKMPPPQSWLSSYAYASSHVPNIVNEYLERGISWKSRWIFAPKLIALMRFGTAEMIASDVGGQKVKVQGLVE